MAMFLIAEAVFFFLLILAFIYFRGTAKLSLAAGSIDTGLLLASGLSMWRAVAGSRLWLAVTIFLGVMFLMGQVSQFLHFVRDGVTMGQGFFGTTFFALAGMHGLHVTAGLVALAIVPATAIRAVAMYWYFFLGAWLAIFLVVYVWSAR
jgi:heme/copper-type cytochrome/quinol oxidase subunit 3